MFYTSVIISFKDNMLTQLLPKFSVGHYLRPFVYNDRGYVNDKENKDGHCPCLFSFSPWIIYSFCVAADILHLQTDNGR